MPWLITQRDDEWCVFKAGADGTPTGDALGCHATEADAEAQRAALEATVEEQAAAPAEDAPDVVRETVDDTLVSEFGGRTPSVPFAPGIDVADLTAGDDNPMYLVLPISEVGAVSRNGLVHDDDLADSLVRQIMSDRPGGIMGHIPDSARSTAHPVNQIHWVGAVKADGKVWAKGYIPRTQADVREEYRILKAKRGKAATSIYGSAVKETVNGGGPLRWRARNFVLEQIDLAPYARASLPGDGQFVITSEMTEGEPAATTERTVVMEKAQVIAELTATDAPALPDAVRQEIIAEYQATHEAAERVATLESDVEAKTARIAELEAAADQQRARVAELEQRLTRLDALEAEQWGRDLDGKIAELTDWQVSQEDNKAKLDGLRKLIRQQVEMRLGTVREMAEVEATLTDLLNGDLKVVVETIRDALAGGPVVVGEQQKADTVHGVKLDDSPEQRKADAALFGVA